MPIVRGCGALCGARAATTSSGGGGDGGGGGGVSFGGVCDHGRLPTLRRMLRASSAIVRSGALSPGGRAAIARPVTASILGVSPGPGLPPELGPSWTPPSRACPCRTALSTTLRAARCFARCESLAAAPAATLAALGGPMRSPRALPRGVPPSSRPSAVVRAAGGGCGDIGCGPAARAPQQGKPA